MPGGIDHARDLVALEDAPGDQVAGLVFDFSGSFMMAALRFDEQRFNCAEVRDLGWLGTTTFIVWDTLGLGGTANPAVYSRFGIFAVRTKRALCQPSTAGPQTYVDDPAIVTRGRKEQCQE